MPSVSIKPSNKKDKTYDAFIYYNNSQKRPYVISFGSRDTKDYTTGATNQQRDAYRTRNKSSANDKFNTISALTYHILWKSRDVKENIKSYKKKYNLK